MAASKFATLAWLDENPAAARYVKGCQDQDTPARALFLFFRWLKGQPGWVSRGKQSYVSFVLDEQGACRTDRERSRLEDLLIDYLNDEIKGSRNYKLRIWASVHGLFAKHRIAMPRSKPSILKFETNPVEGKLTLDEIRRIVDEMKPREQAIFKLMFQGFMDSERFAYFNTHAWPLIEPQLENEEEEWLRFEWPYRKQNDKPYYVAWHKSGDAIQALRSYLEQRGTPRRTTIDARGNPVHEPIFLNNWRLPYAKKNIQESFLEAGTRAGIIERVHPYCGCKGIMQLKRQYNGMYQNGGARMKRVYECQSCGNQESPSKYAHHFKSVRYGRGPHEMRDVLRSSCYVAGVPDKLVEFFMGHKVDPLYYHKFMDLERITGLPFEDVIGKDWRKAEPFLNLWTHTTALIGTTKKIQEQAEMIQQLRATIRAQEERMNKMEAWIIGQQTNRGA